MRKFDTKVQHLKHKVLREVARLHWNDALLQKSIEIPAMIVPGKTPTMRCCVYRERAILAERVRLLWARIQTIPMSLRLSTLPVTSVLRQAMSLPILVVAA